MESWPIDLVCKHMLRLCYAGEHYNAPADVQQWLQQVATGRPAAMLHFCTQWAKSLHCVQHWNRGSCYLFKYGSEMALVACLSNIQVLAKCCISVQVPAFILKHDSVYTP